MEACVIDDGALRADLVDAYLQLDCYPEVRDALSELKRRGLRTAVLSNGSPRMLRAAVECSGLGELLDEVYSADEVGVYKPDRRVYQLACDALGVAPAAISFQSSNAWDAAGAAHFGMQVAWVNRFRQPPERLPGRPHIELTTLAELPAFVR